MATNWYYMSKGERHGPITSVLLKQLAANGVLLPTDLVCQGESTKWVSANQIKGLFSTTPSSSTTQPPVIPTKNKVAVVESIPQIQVSTQKRFGNEVGGTAASEPIKAATATLKNTAGQVTEAFSNLYTEGIQWNQQSTQVNQLDVLVAEYRKSILEYLRQGNAANDLAFVREFRQNLQDLVERQEAAGKRCQIVQSHATALASNETEVKTAMENAKKQKLVLDNLAQALGKSAFAAFQSGQIMTYQAFAARIDLQNRLDQLQLEHNSLAAKPDASFLEKTKAGAMQLVVTGKIKLEETKVNSLDAQVGKVLLDTKAEYEVNSSGTLAIINQIQEERQRLSASQSIEQAAQASLATAKKQISAELGIQDQDITSSTLNDEVIRCQAEVSSLEKRSQEAVDLLCQHLVTNEAQINDAHLGQLVRNLNGRQGELAVAKSVQAEKTAKQQRSLMIVSGVVLGALALTGILFGIFRGPRSEDNASNGSKGANHNRTDKNIDGQKKILDYKAGYADGQGQARKIKMVIERSTPEQKARGYEMIELENDLAKDTIERMRTKSHELVKYWQGRIDGFKAEMSDP